MNVTIKNGSYILCFSVLVGLMSACLGGSNHLDDYALTDAELLSFGLSSDSVPGLSKVIFSIDQNGENGVGFIYNRDSMAYLTEIPDSVIINYTSAAGIENVMNITDGDSIWVKQGDSINVSKPQTLKVFALDGKTVKLYNMQLNIHQVDPDSVQYSRIASDLSFLKSADTKTVVLNKSYLTYSRLNTLPPPEYSNIQLHTTQDMVIWNGEFSGLPANAVIGGIQSNGNQLFAYTDEGELYTRYDSSADYWILIDKPDSIKVISILGYLYADSKHAEKLCMVVETNGKYVFASTEDFIQWDCEEEFVPEDFPLYDFTSHSYQLMLTERVTLFGGLAKNGVVQNTVWSTEDGHYWAKLTGSSNVFPPLRGANVFFYDEEFWLINGKSENEYNENVYSSTDGGITWTTKPQKFGMQEDYLLRYGASVVTDKENKSFYIIGGKQDEPFPEVWRGFLNRRNFK